MSTYATWSFYHDEYRGKADESTYRRLAFQAYSKIIELTFRKSEQYKSNSRIAIRLALCQCALVDKMKVYEDADEMIPAGLTSINNDGFSASRGSRAGTVSGTDDSEQAFYRLCLGYLRYPINLLYRGIDDANIRHKCNRI